MAATTAGTSPHLRPALTLVAALAAAAVLVPAGQWLFGLMVAAPDFAATSAATQETVFTLMIFGALLAVAATGLTIEHGWGHLGGISPARNAGVGLGIGLGGLLICIVIAGLALGVHPRAGNSFAAGPIIGGTLLVLFQAGVEEVYFRGWLQPVLSRAWGNIAGLLVTAAAFAMLHLLGGDRSLTTLANLILGGLLFGLLAQRSGGIVMSVAAHFAWNWAEGIGLGLAPNPGVGSFGALFDLDMTGSGLWGGSSEGLNASLAMTFVLAALILPVAAWPGGSGNVAEGGTS